MSRYTTAPLNLSPEDRRLYRKMKDAVGVDEARKMMGLPGPGRNIPDNPILAPIFNGSVSAVARATGISEQSIRQWRRERSPRLDNLQAALRACGFRLQLAPIYEDAAE